MFATLAPMPSEADEILAEWADVESRLNGAKASLESLAVGSAEAKARRSEVDRLIQEWAGLWLSYRRLAELADERQQPALPRWPDPAI